VNRDCLFISLSDLPQITKTSFLELKTIIDNKPEYYTSFKRQKKDGTFREITPPIKFLKVIQRRIKNHLESHLEWSSVVHGGIKDRSVVTNAKPHIGKRWVANLDISKFFPSTTKQMIENALMRCGIDKAAAGVLAELTTFKDSLPQGCPTSSLLGNLCLEPMDSKYMAFCRKYGFAYTRFVDDITVSGNKELKPFRGTFIGFIADAGYQVAPHKIFFKGAHEQQLVTGLIVNQTLKPSPDFMRGLKKTLRQCWPENGGPEPVCTELGISIQELRMMLRGKIEFVFSIRKAEGRTLRAYLAGIKWP
jgi:RNA-directed DNA polymerase